MTTLHEARIERAARLVAEAETSRAEAWDAASIAQAAYFSARDASNAAHVLAWRADLEMDAARAAQANAIDEGE